LIADIKIGNRKKGGNNRGEELQSMEKGVDSIETILLRRDKPGKLSYIGNAGNKR